MENFSCVFALGLLLGAANDPRADQGLVACYGFDEGSGPIAQDLSGHGNDGTIHGARFTRNGSGYALAFDGMDDYVDCGAGPSLNLTDAITLEAWVRPEGVPQGEPAILGKFFTSFLLTYYENAGCYWYVNDGRNNLRVPLSPGLWHHVAATFDGTQMKLYLNGKQAAARTLTPTKVAAEGRFLIGCTLGDPRTDLGPAHPNTAYFRGLIDEVRVYGRALPSGEVQAHFQAGLRKLDLLAKYPPFTAAVQVSHGDTRLRVGHGGSVEVVTPRGTLLVESSYSFPGDRIGWNSLTAARSRTASAADEKPAGEAEWQPRARQTSAGAVRVEARGQWYRLRRDVRLRDGKIEWTDVLTNVAREPVGLLIHHDLTTPQAFRDTLGPGAGENPTVFLVGEEGHWGVLLEDNLSRLRYEAGLGVPANRARLRIADLAIDVGQSLTLRWSLYPLPQEATYFDFVNLLRREWKTNFTVEGPFAYFHPGAPEGQGWWLPWQDPPRLQAYLQRKRLGIIAFLPFLDYDPGYFDHVLSRAEYKELMQPAIRALKAADPHVKCLGCIECDWVTIDPTKIPGGDLLPSAQRGDPSGERVLTAPQTRVIDASDLPWKDSLKRNAEGNLTLELYVRGVGKDSPQTALAVYPAVGNYHYQFLLDQVKFLLDEVGFDGFYVDQFSMVWSGTRSYGGWDGVSAEIDTHTGRIARPFIDANLAGIQARVHLCQYALQRGKVVVANTYATSREEQALPIHRFSEVWNAFDPMAPPVGDPPVEVPLLYRGLLASPIALGIQGDPQKQDTAERTLRAVVGYLRHGLLYYHYHIEDIPETGPGSGQYGPINHTFPITPLEVGEGFIIGRERIVTAVSLDRLWAQRTEPAVHVFDLTGRPVKDAGRSEVHPQGSRWRVVVRLRDWAEIAVVE